MNALIEGEKRRAVQHRSDRANVLVDQCDNWCSFTDVTRKDTWDSLLRGLERETEEVVALKESLSVVDSARDVTNVYTGE